MDLTGISFGDRVAENESTRLSNYFVKTEQWNSLFSGDVDVIFGSKGSGKSALYTLLLNNADRLRAKGIVLLSAEKPTGKTVFSDITTEPPTTENEFVTLWKVYICQLIVHMLMEQGICDGSAEKVAMHLIDADLIEDDNTLRKLVNKAKAFAKRLIALESAEGGLSAEGVVTGKITFREPSQESQKAGYRSVDDLLSTLNQHLAYCGYFVWMLCDRLDVAFDESIDLEKNALRALFKVYRDLEEYQNIRLKIFLRDDIWRRITQDGFREASHITRTATISWNDKNLMNLIVSRALGNSSLIDQYQVDKNIVLSDYEKQVEFYYKMLPRQVDIGEKQSDSFNWIKSRIRDGLNNVAPREIIHYYNESLAQERKEQELGNDSVEGTNMLSRQAIKNASLEVSKVRTEQTIFAEYADLKPYILALENSKAEHTLESLSTVWKLDPSETSVIANELAAIGFFESKTAKSEGLFKVPFLYRFYLEISQGKAF
jgi:hypothetical protein